MNICDGHCVGFEKNIYDFVLGCNSRELACVGLIQKNFCLESYPCQGHKGVYAIFNNGETFEFSCGSVMAGVIMYFCGELSEHCVSYVSDSMRKKIDNLRQTKYPMFKTLG